MDFVQNKLGLRKRDFIDILPLIKSNKPVHTLIGENKIVAMFEVYRGNRKIGKKVIIYKDGKLVESTCKEFIKLWNYTEMENGNIEPSVLLELVSELYEKFEKEKMPEYRGNFTKTGFIRGLWHHLYYGPYLNKQLIPSIDRNKLKKVITYLSWSELNPHEVKAFREHLVKIGVIREKDNKPLDTAKLVDAIYDYFRIGDINKKLNKKLIGWWY